MHTTVNGKILRRSYEEYADRARGLGYYLKTHGYKRGMFGRWKLRTGSTDTNIRVQLEFFARTPPPSLSASSASPLPVLSMLVSTTA